MAKTVLVTGASAGIGKATAIYLAQNGYNVYGAARRTEKMQDLKNYSIKPIALDVTKEGSITACIEQIFTEAGNIDILVNNAGFGSSGAVEDVPMDDARYQLEVNVFGAMRLTQLVLPKMRQNKYGKIINISSIGGKIAFPLSGWYHASKFAIEALSDTLRMEVKPFGIDVIGIEPGGIRSEWAAIANEHMMRISGNTIYKEIAANAEKATANMNLPEPIVIAKLIKKSIEARNPKTRYAGGFGAKQILAARKIVSDKLMDKIIMSQMKG
ncbi:short-chain dehydrogenase/reductase [Niastella yeongjuensis]|uniref:Short-chain dehydrogenase/reductase n=1 Tax=Niastella yeongjuensis TaxID=354355 RepID=A0A1V9E4Z9_9BACT|nr:oxidoreductase [Niastella yeongjuensis]OQP41094.1 short-chain dehydrogenase/reductase [Niastella yeongjuensis]SEO92359.1 Short-chain dehydrogenase [Niastella yeongjuensis]